MNVHMHGNGIPAIYVELLQVIFWFNPLIHIVKHFIKMNHEFLADRAVLQKGIQTSAYQQILLTFSSGALTNNLANSINYSLMKKRFTVMKKHTTKKTIWIKSFLLLPLLAILIYGCSTEKVVENALENHSTYKVLKYIVIDNNGIPDTLETKGLQFNFSKNPAEVYTKQGDTIYLKNPYFSNHDAIANKVEIIERDINFFKTSSETIYYKQGDTITRDTNYFKQGNISEVKKNVVIKSEINILKPNRIFKLNQDNLSHSFNLKKD